MSDRALPWWGCTLPREEVDPSSLGWVNVSRTVLERQTAAGESPVGDDGSAPVMSDREYRPTRDIGWEAGGTTSQGYLHAATDSAQYREGTVKSTPARGVK